MSALNKRRRALNKNPQRDDKNRNALSGNPQRDGRLMSALIGLKQSCAGSGNG